MVFEQDLLFLGFLEKSLGIPRKTEEWWWEMGPTEARTLTHMCFIALAPGATIGGGGGLGSPHSWLPISCRATGHTHLSVSTCARAHRRLEARGLGEHRGGCWAEGWSCHTRCPKTSL